MNLIKSRLGVLLTIGLFSLNSLQADAQSSNTSCTCDNSFLNGSFEAPSIPKRYTQKHEDQVPGWQTTASDHKIEIWKSGFNSVPSAHGTQFAELNATQVSTLFQELCLEPGSVIEWSIYHRGRSGVDVAKIKMGSSLSSAVTQATMTDGNTAWGYYTGTYTVPLGQYTTFFALESVSSTGSNSYGNFIDGFKVRVITDPCDSDGDGVKDQFDDYPNDPDRAFNSYYPASKGTLAYEDLWPAKGDFDFNDLVVDYQFKTVTNANNFVVEVFSEFTIRATGAGYHNGFGFQLPTNNVASNHITVTGASLQKNYINVTGTGLEAGQNKPTVIVFDDSYNLLYHPGSGLGVNTDPSAPMVAPTNITVKLSFELNTYVSGDLDLANFNPFLIANGIRGREVHLPDYAPTALADNTLFGTVDDNTQIGQNRFYKTANNLPWAINIPVQFEYSKEKVEVLNAYYFFDDWCQSGGTAFQNWYQNNSGYRNNANVY